MTFYICSLTCNRYVHHFIMIYKQYHISTGIISADHWLQDNQVFQAFKHCIRIKSRKKDKKRPKKKKKKLMRVFTAAMKLITMSAKLFSLYHFFRLILRNCVVLIWFAWFLSFNMFIWLPSDRFWKSFRLNNHLNRKRSISSKVKLRHI